MKNLYLHIGTRKTATSSIQKTIYNNRNIFEKNGLYYPKKWREAHNLEIYCMFADKPENYAFNVFNKYTKAEVEKNNRLNKQNIIQEIKKTKCNNILFSAEDASSLTKKNIQNLKEFINLELNISNIKIIVGVRDILSYATSDMQQLIKDGMGKINIHHYKNFYREKLEKFFQVFGKENIIIYKFEDSIKHELGPVGYFCDIIHLPKDILSTMRIEKTNEGISNRAIDLISYINLKIPLLHGLNLTHGRYRGDTQLLNHLSGEKYIPKKEFQAEVIDINSDNLEWLKETCNIDYTKIKLKEINDIGFDSLYVHQLLKVYGQLTPLIQKLVYDYLLEKKEKAFGDSKMNLKSLIAEIQDTFPKVLHFELDSILASVNIVEQANVLREAMIDKIRNLAVEVAVIDLKLAKKLMLIAYEERPQGLFIKDRLDEYTTKLEASISALGIKNMLQREILINKIRNLAIESEQISIELAKKLMLIAHEGRPKGLVIKDKLDEYIKKIEQHKKVPIITQKGIVSLWRKWFYKSN
ncbi:MAG: hypothetical protein U9O64_06945 [Campylobacterota bacterium]|nr:hypothetical protein [Campylobacterota bacterium]